MEGGWSPGCLQPGWNLLVKQVAGTSLAGRLFSYSKPKHLLSAHIISGNNACVQVCPGNKSKLEKSSRLE
jgi:hypothetical protein